MMIRNSFLLLTARVLSPAKPAPHHAGRSPERFHQEPAQTAVRLGDQIALTVRKAKGQVLPPARDVERAEHPVPDRQDLPVVPVVMPWVAAVVDLVLRGRDDDVFQNRTKAQPDMAVSQVRPGKIENVVGPAQSAQHGGRHRLYPCGGSAFPPWALPAAGNLWGRSLDVGDDGQAEFQLLLGRNPEHHHRIHVDAGRAAQWNDGQEMKIITM